MGLQILIDETKVPAQNNLTWVFPVLIDEASREWLVDSFDLNLWFKEALGRYPASTRGDRETLQDLKANWETLRSRFYVELKKQAELGMVLGVEGIRITGTEWDKARRLKPEDLPPLNQVQREAAKKMKVSEEEYARGFVAAEQSKAALLAKTERLARFISDQISRIAPSAKVQRILLSVDHGFEVVLMIEGASTPVRISEVL